MKSKTIWLLDLIAPDRKASTAVLASFQQIAKKEKVSIHPTITRMVDPEFLKKVATPVGGEATEGAPTPAEA